MYSFSFYSFLFIFSKNVSILGPMLGALELPLAPGPFVPQSTHHAFSFSFFTRFGPPPFETFHSNVLSIVNLKQYHKMCTPDCFPSGGIHFPQDVMDVTFDNAGCCLDNHGTLRVQMLWNMGELNHIRFLVHQANFSQAALHQARCFWTFKLQEYQLHYNHIQWIKLEQKKAAEKRRLNQLFQEKRAQRLRAHQASLSPTQDPNQQPKESPSPSKSSLTAKTTPDSASPRENQHDKPVDAELRVTIVKSASPVKFPAAALAKETGAPLRRTKSAPPTHRPYRLWPEYEAALETSNQAVSEEEPSSKPTEAEAQNTVGEAVSDEAGLAVNASVDATVEVRDTKYFNALFAEAFDNLPPLYPETPSIPLYGSKRSPRASPKPAKLVRFAEPVKEDPFADNGSKPETQQTTGFAATSPIKGIKLDLKELFGNAHKSNDAPTSVKLDSNGLSEAAKNSPSKGTKLDLNELFGRSSPSPKGTKLDLKELFGSSVAREPPRKPAPTALNLEDIEATIIPVGSNAAPSGPSIPRKTSRLTDLTSGGLSQKRTPSSIYLPGDFPFFRHQPIDKEAFLPGDFLHQPLARESFLPGDFTFFRHQPLGKVSYFPGDFPFFRHLPRSKKHFLPGDFMFFRHLALHQKPILLPGDFPFFRHLLVEHAHAFSGNFLQYEGLSENNPVFSLKDFFDILKVPNQKFFGYSATTHKLPSGLDFVLQVPSPAHTRYRLCYSWRD